MIDPQMLAYHRSLFQWHCRHFFNFRRHLTALEKRYLEACFAAARSFDEVSEAGYQHFSYYTYSHRVEGDSVNSSRLAYGSVERPEAVLEPAQAVLAERGLDFPASLFEALRFYGLGWDLEAQQFKVYLRSVGWPSDQPLVADLLEPYRPEPYRSELLISLTYSGTEVVERKVYLYPKAAPDRPGVRGEALMVTDRRGVVTQDDVADSERLSYPLSPPGERIVGLYREIGENLDTIAFSSPESYTLYFP